MKLISKYKVIDNIKSIICRRGDAQDILKMVNQMRPLPLKPWEPSQGEWIRILGSDNIPHEYDNYKCSICNYRTVDRFMNTNYCPNCGAQMQEV